MAIGKFRHYVSITRATRIDDGMGGVREESGVEVARVPTDIRELRATELNEERNLQSRVTHQVKFRYNSEVKAGDVINFDGRLFYIEVITNRDYLGRFSTALCREGGPL